MNLMLPAGLIAMHDANLTPLAYIDLRDADLVSVAPEIDAPSPQRMDHGRLGIRRLALYRDL